METVRTASAGLYGNPQAFLFDVIVALARRLQRRERLARWHLTYALVGLLWHRYRQEEVQGLSSSKHFRFELPQVKFHKEVCCKKWNVVTHLLSPFQGQDQRGPSVLTLGLSTGEVEEYILPQIPASTVFVLLSGPERLIEQSAGKLATRLRGYENRLQLAVGGGPPEGSWDLIFFDRFSQAFDVTPEEEFHLLIADFDKLSGMLKGDVGIMAGADFTACHLGVIEAVSHYTRQTEGRQINVGVDGTWWIKPTSMKASRVDST